MSNGLKMYIQKQFVFFGFRLWWYLLDVYGYSPGEYTSIEYYEDLKDSTLTIDIIENGYFFNRKGDMF